MSGPFEVSRADGRSDRQVVLDMAEGLDPGALLSYAELIEELQSGRDGEMDRHKAASAVRSANHALLSERQRYLRNVRGVGYRVCRADEHLPVAIDKKRTATRRLKESVGILRHTRLDELTSEQRALHQGQLLIASALVQHATEANRRLNATERAIAGLTARVDSLEGTSGR